MCQKRTFYPHLSSCSPYVVLHGTRKTFILAAAKYGVNVCLQAGHYVFLGIPSSSTSNFFLGWSEGFVTLSCFPRHPSVLLGRCWYSDAIIGAVEGRACRAVAILTCQELLHISCLCCPIAIPTIQWCWHSWGWHQSPTYVGDICLLPSTAGSKYWKSPCMPGSVSIPRHAS